MYLILFFLHYIITILVESMSISQMFVAQKHFVRHRKVQAAAAADAPQWLPSAPKQRLLWAVN